MPNKCITGTSLTTSAISTVFLAGLITKHVVDTEVAENPNNTHLTNTQDFLNNSTGFIAMASFLSAGVFFCASKDSGGACCLVIGILSALVCAGSGIFYGGVKAQTNFPQHYLAFRDGSIAGMTVPTAIVMLMCLYDQFKRSRGAETSAATALTETTITTYDTDTAPGVAIDIDSPRHSGIIPRDAVYAQVIANGSIQEENDETIILHSDRAFGSP